jgi:hypothetical protein
MFKKFIYSLLMIIVFFGSFELLLRAKHFRYHALDLGFHITRLYKLFARVGDYYETKNDKEGIAFPQRIPVVKRSNKIRICVLGGSSVAGVGEFDILREKLQKTLSPEWIVRIINFGFTSYGTDRLVLQLQEVFEFKPDLIILYSGHNEFEEIYMKKLFYKNNILTSLNDRLMAASKFYQFLSMCLNKLRVAFYVARHKQELPFLPAKTRVQWHIDFDKEEVYRNYQNNILEIIEIAHRHDVPMIIATVAYNRMSPPFKRPPDDTYDNCLTMFKNGLYPAAAGCLEKALDADLQPHRATKTSNDIVKEIAIAEGIPLADVDARIVSVAPNGIPGFELFNDHCHLNERGKEILQDVFYETIQKSKVLGNKFL